MYHTHTFFEVTYTTYKAATMVSYLRRRYLPVPSGSDSRRWLEKKMLYGGEEGGEGRGL